MLHLFTLTWGGKDKITKLKDSLLPALADIDYQWWIKDNGSTDGTVNEIKSWNLERVQPIAYPNNAQNFSMGMNHLFNEAKPKDNDLIMLLNNDVVFNDTTSIEKMTKIIGEPNVGVVGARLLFTNTNSLQHAGVVFHMGHHMPLHFRAGETSDNNAEKNRVFQVVTGAVLLTKAAYYKEAYKNPSGMVGMDEAYHWAFDDVDFCLSLTYNLKKKIVYCGKTNIFHEESASLKKNPVNKLFLRHNVMRLREKWIKKIIPDQDIYMKDIKYNLYK